VRNLHCALRIIFAELRKFALRIYKAICVFAICALKNNRANAQTVLDYLPKCCNSAFVKVIVLKENIKKFVIRILTLLIT